MILLKYFDVQNYSKSTFVFSATPHLPTMLPSAHRANQNAATSITTPSTGNQSNSTTTTPPRMWTCTKCSYAYNPIWVEQCDICESRRTPPSLTQPSLITMTKDDPTTSLLQTTTTTTLAGVTPKETNLNKFVASRSQHAFEEIAASIVEMPPMASFEQDLEDEDDDPEADEDDEFNGDPAGRDGSSTAVEEWTCKKCTLVNSHRVKACVVCGGSRLRSISAIEDMTLRKGEFWSCAQCTLKNSLSASACSACKAVRQVPVISGQQTNFRPYTSSPAVGVRPAHHNRQVLASINSASTNAQLNVATVIGGGVAGGVTASGNNSLVPPVTRMSRSPSPKQDRTNVSGAIPKVFFLLMDIFLDNVK